MSTRSFRVSMFAMLAGLGVSSVAHAHEGDVGVLAFGGQLVTGAVEDLGAGDVVVPGERVFAAEFGIGPGVGDEPGFFMTEGTLPGGSSLGFNIRAALRRWDSGLSTGNFIADETLTIESPSGTESATTPAADLLVNGWSFTVPGSGDFDDHPNFYVNGRTTERVYILELELKTDAGYSNSAPIWLVINDGASEEDHDAAIEWVEENLVPAPGSAAMIGIGGLLLARRRRA